MRDFEIYQEETLISLGKITLRGFPLRCPGATSLQGEHGVVPVLLCRPLPSCLRIRLPTARDLPAPKGQAFWEGHFTS